MWVVKVSQDQGMVLLPEDLTEVEQEEAVTLPGGEAVAVVPVT